MGGLNSDAAQMFPGAGAGRRIGRLEPTSARLGHSTPQAALCYQHAAAGRDQEIADLLSEIAQAPGCKPGRLVNPDEPANTPLIHPATRNPLAASGAPHLPDSARGDPVDL